MKPRFEHRDSKRSRLSRSPDQPYHNKIEVIIKTENDSSQKQLPSDFSRHPLRRNALVKNNFEVLQKEYNEFPKT